MKLMEHVSNKREAGAAQVSGSTDKTLVFCVLRVLCE